MSTTLVTGATGQIGLELCRALRRRGRSVRGLVLSDDPGIAQLKSMGVDPVVGDVRDATAMERACEGAEIVYHLAAVVDTRAESCPRMWQVNVGGAHHVARAAARTKVRRFVYFSSIVVFDPNPVHTPLDETRPRLRGNDLAPYVQSKIQGEQRVRVQLHEGLDTVMLHPTVVVGPHETHHVGIVQSLIVKFFAGSLPAIFGGGFDLVGVDDVIQGALAAEVFGRRGENYILGGQWYALPELLHTARAISGTTVPKLAIPLPLARAALPAVRAIGRLTGRRPLYNREELRQLQGNRLISSAKARQELGYRPRGIQDPLRRIHEAWLADHAGALQPER